MTFDQLRILYRGFLKYPNESHCTRFGRMTEKQWKDRNIGKHPCCDACRIMEQYGIRKK